MLEKQMKNIQEEMRRKWKERRQNSAGSWSSLIIKIALLVLVIWLIINFSSSHGNYLKNFFMNQDSTQKTGESK
jgi:hypothetical protein